MQHDEHGGQGSEELGRDEEGLRFWLGLTLLQAHAHVCVSAALVCPAPHSVSVGRLEEGGRAAQEERYFKQRLWSEASQSLST